MEIIIVILILIIIALSATMLYREFQHLRTENTKLEKRIHDLEQANHKRMPHKAQDNVLDVIAIVSDVLENKQDLNLLEKQRREREERNLEDALKRLKEALSIGTKREGKEE